MLLIDSTAIVPRVRWLTVSLPDMVDYPVGALGCFSLCLPFFRRMKERLQIRLENRYRSLPLLPLLVGHIEVEEYKRIFLSFFSGFRGLKSSFF